MKQVFAMTVVQTLFLLLAASGQAQAQGTVYRCGNEYTNAVKDAKEAQARGCKLVEGGNVTIIQAPRPPANSAGASQAPCVRPPAPARPTAPSSAPARATPA
jgi:hypothetical protein